MRTAVTAAALALTLAAGACGGPAGPEFTKADSDAIRQANQEHTAAFNAKDMDKVLELYAENSVFMPPNAPVLRGKEPLRNFYAGLFTRDANIEMEVEEVSGHGPIAIESGTYTIQYGGEQPTRDRGKYLRVLRNQNGWHVEKMIWSSDLPKPAGG
jgi:uncharacterized protein (TIGR02246 family)